SARTVSSCPLCFFLIPPPPLSPLVPYTTLFRSRLLRRGLDRGYRQTTELTRAPRGRLLIDPMIKQQTMMRGLAVCEVDELTPDIDRKSTRLNSSHVKSSYAVFCLKKKNKNTGTP